MTTFSDLYVELLSSIKTVDERNDLARMIDDLRAHLFRAGGADISKLIRETLPKDLGRILEELLKYLPEGAETMKNFFIAFEKELSSMRVLRLEVAASPSEEMIAAVSKWLREEVGGGILVDFKTDKSILGGARLAFEGRYSELTLTKRVEDILEKNREKLLKQFQ